MGFVLVCADQWKPNPSCLTNASALVRPCRLFAAVIIYGLEGAFFSYVKWPKQLKFSRLRLRLSFLIMNDFCYAVVSLLHSLLHRWTEGQVFRFGAWHVVIST